MGMGLLRKLILGIVGISVFMACVKNRNFDPLAEACATDLMANATYSEIKKLYVDKTIQIQQDFVIARVRCFLR